MQTVKRVVVWLAEIAAEALLLGCLLGALVSNEIGLLYGVIGSVLAVPVVLFLHWYYLTRALAVVVRSIRPQLYPLIAATLFVIHMHVVFVRLKPDMSSLGKAKELPFLAGGACIVFACAFGGNWLLRKWTQARSNGPDPLHRGIVPGGAGV
jgi:hypothetical protein